MCGIVGYVGGRQALPVLLDGLRRLEYRGYDSAGVVVNDGRKLLSIKSVGKIADLVATINGTPLGGTAGLGHTRWATHGGVNQPNAHPHFSCDGRIAVVHNGIVENYGELRRELTGHTFTSGTDTEVIPHLIESILMEGGDLLEAVRKALPRLRGSFALGIVDAAQPGLMVAARVNCPLVLGVGDGETFLASDLSALLPYTRRVIHLEEHEVARISARGIEVFDRNFRPRKRKPLEIAWKEDTALRGGHAHFMVKEIHEQRDTVAAELEGRERTLDELRLPRSIDRIVMAACGTAWHAALVGKMAFEELARIPTEAAMASELRYGAPLLGPRTLLVAVSQSGETADTLAAVRQAREAGSTVIALTNVKGCTLAREADQVLYMRAGPEIGVAATKTYTSQVLNLLLLALHTGRRTGALPKERFEFLLNEARRLPAQVEQVLANVEAVECCAPKFSKGYDFMFMGRRYNLATALEGALKMKEISYVHAEGYGAGEMKHGPLALVDDHMVCVAIAPRSPVTEKMISNIQEVRARKGTIISIATAGDAGVRAVSDCVIEIPECEEMFSPILAVIPLQLLAYRTAVELGRDVDRPRNLAKSVTVE